MMLPEQIHSDTGSGAIPFRCIIVKGLTIYVATSAIAVLGVLFGVAFVELCTAHYAAPTHKSVINGLSAWDGQWYSSIVEHGYTYQSGRQSNTAFAPLYPMIATALQTLTGLSATVCLLIVSHLCFAAATILIIAYSLGRGNSLGNMDLATAAAWGIGLFPGGLFFRMAYAESLFLVLLLMAMIAMQRRWHPLIVAAIIGASTTCRLLGVALLVPFAFHLAEISAGQKLPSRAIRSILLLSAACWGVAALLVVGAACFDRPDVFFSSHQEWRDREFLGNIWERGLSLFALEPIWSVFDPTCKCYWGNDPPTDQPLFNMSLFHPVLFTVGAVAVGWGAVQRQLTTAEWLLAVGLLGIPYATRSYELCMAGAGRHTAVVFPVFFVFAVWSHRHPNVIKPIGLISAIYLFVFSALFATWYWVF